MSTNEVSKSMPEDKADDPLLRILKSDKDEAKAVADQQLEIKKKQLESTKRIVDSRNALFYKTQEAYRKLP
ncbi:MAG: hypothetical protein LH679_04270 [Cyanobacteria bacterium CAN_BIN43]|nr:hypothetical protein [Cyanobacteria bacterium CAN_BIN43]